MLSSVVDFRLTFTFLFLLLRVLLFAQLALISDQVTEHAWYIALPCSKSGSLANIWLSRCVRLRAHVGTTQVHIAYHSFGTVTLHPILLELCNSEGKHKGVKEHSTVTLTTKQEQLVH